MKEGFEPHYEEPSDAPAGDASGMPLEELRAADMQDDSLQRETMEHILATTESLDAVLEEEDDDDPEDGPAEESSDEETGESAPADESEEIEADSLEEVDIVQKDLYADRSDPGVIEAAQLAITSVWEEEPDDQDAINDFFDLLSADGTVSLCASEGERTIGVVVLKPSETESDEASVAMMAVEESYRGQGLGTRLLQAIEEEAASRQIRRLSVFPKSAAVSLYERSGYVIDPVIDDKITRYKLL